MSRVTSIPVFAPRADGVRRHHVVVVTLSKHTSIPFPVVMRLRLAGGCDGRVDRGRAGKAGAAPATGGTCESVTARALAQSSMG